MMTPELNARIVEIELAQRRETTKTATWWSGSQEERRSTNMKHYAKYLRYAISSLASVAFGLMWN